MTQKILIVEDDSLIAAHIEDVLVNAGYTVVGMVSTGESALLMAEKVPVDLILMDIMLKGPIDGIKTASMILQKCDLPIIYLTAYAEQELLSRAKDTAPYGYLTKPVDERELIATITMALARHAKDKKLKEREGQYREVFRKAILPVLPDEPVKTAKAIPEERRAS
jgi:DNA-binding response OmpR family regulator